MHGCRHSPPSIPATATCDYTAFSRPTGLGTHKRHTYRLSRAANLQVRTKRRKKGERPRVPLEIPTRANQRWAMDCVSDPRGNGRRVRVPHVINDCTRAVVGQLIAVGSTGQQGARFLEQLRAHRPLPPLVVCDHGPELTSTALFFWACNRGTG